MVPRLILGCALLAGILQQETEEDPLPDYYARLKVSHTAGLSTIKKSFRKLAMQFHPDKNKDAGAEDIFQELSEAYSVLGSEEKKAEYDELYREEYLQRPDHHVHHADDFTDEELNEVNIDTLDDIGQMFDDLPRHGDGQAAPPRPQYEDVPVEQAEETVEPLDDVKVGRDSHDNVWGDLDDEALFKVLRFLADHDYEISKKTVFKEAQPEGRAEGQEKARWRRSTDFNDYRHEHVRRGHDDTWAYEPPHLKYSGHDHHYSEYDHQFSGQNYRYSSHGRSGHSYAEPRYAGHGGQRYGVHDHHRRHSGHRYSEDRYYEEDGHYSRTGPSYCRTTVRWEGGVKLTQKRCH